MTTVDTRPRSLTDVPTAGMPTWLRTVADWNPISAFAAAVRTLFGDPTGPTNGVWPLEHPVVSSLGMGGDPLDRLRTVVHDALRAPSVAEELPPAGGDSRPVAVDLSGSSTRARVPMFAQIIRGKVSDATAVDTTFARWSTDLAPGAEGWLGTTGGVTEDSELFRPTPRRP